MRKVLGLFQHQRLLRYISFPSSNAFLAASYVRSNMRSVIAPVVFFDWDPIPNKTRRPIPLTMSSTLFAGSGVKKFAATAPVMRNVTMELPPDTIFVPLFAAKPGVREIVQMFREAQCIISERSFSDFVARLVKDDAARGLSLEDVILAHAPQYAEHLKTQPSSSLAAEVLGELVKRAQPSGIKVKNAVGCTDDAPEKISVLPKPQELSAMIHELKASGVQILFVVQDDEKKTFSSVNSLTMMVTTGKTAKEVIEKSILPHDAVIIFAENSACSVSAASLSVVLTLAQMIEIIAGVQPEQESNSQPRSFPTSTGLAMWHALLLYLQNYHITPPVFYNKARFLTNNKRSSENTVYTKARVGSESVLETRMVKQVKVVLGSFLPTGRSFRVPDPISHKLEGLFCFDPEKNSTTHVSGLEAIVQESCSVLVGVDIKTELVAMWGNPRLQEFLRKGGRIWCIELAEHLLGGCIPQPLVQQLKKCSLRYEVALPEDLYDCLKKVNLATIGEKRVGELLTALHNIYMLQVERAARTCQLKSITKRMDSLIASAAMEHNGIFVNVAGKEDSNDMASLERQLAAFIPEKVADRAVWSWSNPLHCSIALFGGCWLGANPRVEAVKNSKPLLPASQVLPLRCARAFHGGNFDGWFEKSPYTLEDVKAESQSLGSNTLCVLVGTATEVVKSQKFLSGIAFLDITDMTTYSTSILVEGPANQKELALSDLSDFISRCPAFAKQKKASVALLISDPNDEALLKGAKIPQAVAAAINLSPKEVYLVHMSNVIIERASFADDINALFQKSNTTKGVGEMVYRLSAQKKELLAAAGSQPTHFPMRVVSDVLCMFGRLVGTDSDPFMQLFSRVEPSPQFDGEVEGILKLLTPVQRTKISEWMRSSGGSTNSDTLTVLADLLPNHPLPSLLKKYRAARHDESLTNHNSTFLCAVRKQDSCVHPEISHTGTQTGRLTSANPNCHGFPKSDKSTFRKLLTSRFGEQGVLLEFDYSQLEVITLCMLCQDPKMTEDLKNRVDFHCLRVAMMHPDLTYDDVVRKVRIEKDPETIAFRTAAKRFSFQRQYGASVSRMQFQTGLSTEQMNKLVIEEGKKYPRIEDYTNTVRQSALYGGLTRSQFWTNFYGEDVADRLVKYETASYHILPTGSKCGFHQAPSRQVLKNHPIQSQAAEIVQVMTGIVARHFINNGDYEKKAFLINSVHDSLWIDTHKSVRDMVVKDVSSILGQTTPTLNSIWPEWKIEVDFRFDVSCGTSLYDMIPINDA